MKTEACIDRGFDFAEKGLFKKADRFFDIALKESAENARAYFGKLLVEFKAKTPEELAKRCMDFTKSENYKKANEYADGSFKRKLNSCVKEYEKAIKDRETLKISARYTIVKLHMDEAKTVADYEKVVEEFKTFEENYIDVDKLLKECKERIFNIKFNEAILAKGNAKTAQDFSACADMFEALGTEHEEVKEHLDFCRNNASVLYYKAAESLAEELALDQSIEMYTRVARSYELAGDYLDAEEKAKKFRALCGGVAEQIAENEVIMQETRELNKKARRKSFLKFLIFALIVSVIAAGVAYWYFYVYKPNQIYSQVHMLFNNGSYIETLKALGDLAANTGGF